MTVRHERARNSTRTTPECVRTADIGSETRPILAPWGWAVVGYRWTWLIVNWCFRNRKCLTRQFRSQYRRTRREVFPILSRIQDIGYEMGKNGRTPEWYRANHRTPLVAKKVGSIHDFLDVSS